GANSEDAPLRVSKTGRALSQDTFEVDEDIDVNTANDKRQYRDIPKLKLHAQWQWDEWEAWGRYTRGGELKPPSARQLSDGREHQSNELGSQQATVMLRYQKDIARNWKAHYKLSYDILDYERSLRDGANIQSYREDEALVGAQINWEPDTAHSLAAGVEWTHEKFGLGSPGYPDEPSRVIGYVDNPNDWSTNTGSLYFEHQWRHSEHVISFLSGRFDENTYTDTLFSPRAAIVYSPWESDVFKWILARSQRMNFAVDMRNEYLQNDIDDTEPEVLDNFEFRWQHTYSDSLSSAISFYYEEMDRIGFIVSTGPDNRSQGVIADESQWGIELEAAYRTGDLTIQFSHVFTKLEQFELRNGVESSFISAKPNGYGDSLTNWSNNLTKLYGSYAINQHWLVHSSLVYYWGFDGSEDRSNYRASRFALAREDDGDIYDRQAYLNIGAEYNTREKLIVGLTGHNLLGLVDKQYNKRNYYLSDDGIYRIQAPSLGLQVRYTLD
ncbi:MAG: hypothetical protein R3208_21765, partial [Ketobacteraceae bacterium]|nr:hypothetical protein [Ketobacteraceae bacterium]